MLQPKVDKDNPFWHKIPARFGAETVLKNAQACGHVRNL